MCSHGYAHNGAGTSLLRLQTWIRLFWRRFTSEVTMAVDKIMGELVYLKVTVAVEKSTLQQVYSWRDYAS